jgi:hypothetical protein
MLKVIASQESIFERLIIRGEVEGNWCFQQTKKCLEAFRDECFEEYIETDGVSNSASHFLYHTDDMQTFCNQLSKQWSLCKPTVH